MANTKTNQKVSYDDFKYTPNYKFNDSTKSIVTEISNKLEIPETVIFYILEKYFIELKSLFVEFNTRFQHLYISLGDTMKLVIPRYFFTEHRTKKKSNFLMDHLNHWKRILTKEESVLFTNRQGIKSKS